MDPYWFPSPRCRCSHSLKQRFLVSRHLLIRSIREFVQHRCERLSDSLNSPLLLVVLELTIFVKHFERTRNGNLFRQHDDTNTAQDRTQVNQTSESPQSAGRCGHQCGNLARVRCQACFAGRDTQSMVFFNSGVMELLYSGEEISRPS